MGDRVVFCGENCIEYFFLLFGCARVGAVCAPISWRLTADDAAAIAEEANAAVVVLGAEHGNDDPEHRRSVARRLVCVGATGVDSWDNWVAPHQPVEARHVPGTDETCYQLYTSGTTGRPKGVQLTHAGVVGSRSTAAAEFLLEPSSVHLLVMPISHSVGTSVTLAALWAGATTVIVPTVDRVQMLRAIAEHHVTHLVVVPTVLHDLLSDPTTETADLSSLKVVVYGGSSISPVLLREATDRFEVAFVQGYGLTETSGAIAVLRPEDHRIERGLLDSVGRPWGDVELRIVDAAGNEVPEGETGELLVRSRQVTTGYWRRPQKTAQVLSPEGWLGTGDAACFRDGYVYLTGRLDDLISTGAEQVAPDEVEDVLVQHDAIAAAAVVGTPHPRWGQTVTAVLVAATDERPSDKTVIAHCHEHLAGYKCPTRIEWTTELPRTASGKLQRALVRQSLLDA